MNNLHIDSDFIDQNNDYKALVAALHDGFASHDIHVPMRHHHDFKVEGVAQLATLLLMPAWEQGSVLGMKMVTVHPENSAQNLPTVHGTYILQNAQTGQLLATLDGQAITAKRTAATSALAADYLAREDAESLLILGTGTLAKEMVEAYLSIRPLKKIYLWGRHLSKAEKLLEKVTENENSRAAGCQFEAINDYLSIISQVDMLVSVTASTEPLVFGDKIRAGQHIDLVGAYRTDMRESDDALMRKAKIYLDTIDGGINGSGDIAQPIQAGVINQKDIVGDLHGLTREDVQARESDDEITVFKSVGHALEDLVAARFFYNQYKELKHDD